MEIRRSTVCQPRWPWRGARVNFSIALPPPVANDGDMDKNAALQRRPVYSGRFASESTLVNRDSFRMVVGLACACIALGGCWPMPMSEGDDSDPVSGELPGVPDHSFVSAAGLPAVYRESPKLHAKVVAGELPPVKERLPDEPLVIVPLERIGKYGGTWRRAFTGPGDLQNADRLMHDHLIYFDLDGRTIRPHIAQSWQVSDDGRVYTFQLRRGMKWSDGAPFTSADFVFAYEDVVLHGDLGMSKPTWLKTKQGIGKIEALDELQIRVVFRDPNYVFPDLCAGLTVGGQWGRAHQNSALFLPRHYLQSFHARYRQVDELEREAKAAGFPNWSAYFREKSQPQRNPAVPTVGPWQTVKPITAEQFVLERNPYYWCVDPQGNQLPYLDRVVMRLAGDPEVLNLRAIAGEIDMQHRHIQLSKAPVLHDNAKQGDYRVLLWPDLGGNDCCVFFNQNYEDDAEIASLLQSLDFRRALSLAIDRDEINELVFLGTAVPRAFLPPADTPYYPGAQFEMASAELDRDQANRLLDGLGLEEKDAHGFRQPRDGKGRLVINMDVQANTMLDYRGVAELVERHWAQVGIFASISLVERTLYNERLQANQMQVTFWNPGGSENLWAYPFFVVPFFSVTQWAPATGDWYATGGKSGKPPTPVMRRLLDLYELGSTLPLEQRIPIGQEIWRIHAENLFVVGTVGLSPAVNGVVVVKNHFRNVPDVAPNSPLVQNPGVARPETFFFDN